VSGEDRCPFCSQSFEIAAVSFGFFRPCNILLVCKACDISSAELDGQGANPRCGHRRLINLRARLDASAAYFLNLLCKGAARRATLLDETGRANPNHRIPPGMAGIKMGKLFGER
jgi:hypothetical protein